RHGQTSASSRGNAGTEPNNVWIKRLIVLAAVPKRRRSGRKPSRRRSVRSPAPRDQPCLFERHERGAGWRRRAIALERGGAEQFEPGKIGIVVTGARHPLLEHM